MGRLVRATLARLAALLLALLGTPALAQTAPDCPPVAQAPSPEQMQAGLRGRHHKGARLDGARALHDVPMRFARLFGEAGGRAQHEGASLGFSPIEIGEAHIVADRQAQKPEGRLDQLRHITAGIGG